MRVVRRFEFQFDQQHARAVNETLGHARRFRRGAAAAALLLGAATAGLVLNGHPWAYILAAVTALGGLTALWLAVSAPGRAGTLEKLYERGELVPAVVSEVRPRGAVLLALVDVAKPDAPSARYALVARKVRRLPGHEMKAGEHVPAVVEVTDQSARGPSVLWESVTAMPIAWATTDREVIQKARAAISDVEWRLLEDNMGLSAKVRRTRTKRILLDSDQLPDDLEHT